MNNYPTIVLSFEKPVNGYWDGGAKQRLEFTADHERTDNKGTFVKWGSWSANFYFHSGKGKTPMTAAAYAVKRIKALYRGGTPFTVEVRK
jgi:hypothetical protein